LSSVWGITYIDELVQTNVNNNPQVDEDGGEGDDPTGGTCASMPVLHVAIGRRLGYLFARA
jgi:hypothetical protein